MRLRISPSLTVTAVFALSLLVPSGADAATEFGDDCAANGSAANSYYYPEEATLYEEFAEYNPLPTEAPHAGVITKWKVNKASGVPIPQTMKVVRNVGTGSTVLIVGEAAGSITAINSFDTRIAVQEGDFLSLYASFPGGTLICKTDEFNLIGGFFGAGGGVGSYNPWAGQIAPWRIPVTAIIEPDADNDGFGDETQDQCPTDASTQGPCPSPLGSTPPTSVADTNPPETTISKGAPNKTDKTSVQFKFRSDEAGSTFECKLDRKPFKSCFSPKKVKRLTAGKHKFKVRAKDAAGNVDPSPAVDKFEVVG